MCNSKRIVKSSKWALAGLLVLTLAIFAQTVHMRQAWFGWLSEGMHEWLSGTTLVASKNWYREGVFNLKFLILENPKSIEFDTIEKRKPYYSYPPGAVLPIYAISKIRGKEPSAAVLMEYNLLNHFLIAFLLALTTYYLLLGIHLSRISAFIYSLIPPASELLLPAPLYWHQNVFFSDQAIILPFVAFVFLETIRYRMLTSSNRLLLNVVQGLVLFYGIFTDWFFVFLSLAVYLVRFVRGEMGLGIIGFVRKSFVYWLPAVIALLLFGWQIAQLDGLDTLISIGKGRIGTAHDVYSQHFNTKLWARLIPWGYGQYGVHLLTMSIAGFVGGMMYVIYRKIRGLEVGYKLSALLSLMAITLAPSFAQIYTFQNHSAVHDFSVLKLSVSISLIPFVVLPVMLAEFFNVDYFLSFFSNNKFVTHLFSWNWKNFPILPVLMVIVASAYLIDQGSRHNRFFGFKERKYMTFLDIGTFIDTNTNFNDVVFSPDFEIPRAPPDRLSYSMKRVYKAKNLSDINRQLENMGLRGKAYNVVLFQKNGKSESLPRELRGLVIGMKLVSHKYGYRLYYLKYKIE